MSLSITTEARKLTQFRALSFDVFGTLIDWETGISGAVEPLMAKSTKRWTKQDAIQAFNELEHQLQVEHPTMLYSEVLSNVYKGLASRLELPPPAESDAIAFGASLKDWPPFPDTIDALRRLSKHYRLVVLSNVDVESFKHTQKTLEHGFAFDKIITAQEVGSYKPDLRNFQAMLGIVSKEFGIDSNQVLVTAQSLFHDHAPANKIGLASSWISRKGAETGANNPAKYTFRFDTLGQMADAVELESQAKHE